MAAHYDRLYDPRRVDKAGPALHDLFRRRGPVDDVLDVACGTFALDLPLLKRGYRIVGRDLSRDMLRVARRTLDLGRTFDAILCLGSAFNYVVGAKDVARAVRGFRRHLRPGGLLVLDLTNFAAWLRRPKNARAEVDYRAPDGTRIAIFAFNKQDPHRRIHCARFFTVAERGPRIDVWFDEAPFRIWTRPEIQRVLASRGFRTVEWWGELRLGVRYVPSQSPRLVSVSVRV